MELKEAVTLAKQYIREVFADERITNLGLEEIEFDDTSGAWLVTIGFSRPWDDAPASVAAMFSGASRQRDYKVVRISDSDKKMVSVKNREPVT
jgi:hypothetical protein